MQNTSNAASDPTPLFSVSVTAPIEGVFETLTGKLESWRFPILIVLSVLYFWTTAFQAERKLYWFDEVLTVHISHQATLHSVWLALTHGADFNPPLVYLLTGLSQQIIGNTSLANRMPELIAVWVFCLSLYFFTYRFAGARGALIAFLFPLVTIAAWYSSEARPHALVLGFAGLAAVCWQQAQSGKFRPLWLTGLALSLNLALLSHGFAVVVFVPIALAELASFAVTRRFRVGVWVAMFFGGFAILVSFAILHAYESELGGVQIRPGVGMVIRTYMFLLKPAALVLGCTVCAILMPWRKLLPNSSESTKHEAADNRFRETMTVSECALVLGFVLIPVISFTLAFVDRVTFYSRYGLGAVFGFACILALVSTRRAAVSLFVLGLIFLQCAQNAASFSRQSETNEPVTSLPISLSAKNYATRYRWIIDAGRTDLPIVLINDLDFAPTIFYAPPELAKRMIFGWHGYGVVNARLYQSLLRYTNSMGSVMPLQEVIDTYPTFLLLASDTVSTAREIHDNDTLNTILPRASSVTMLQAQGDIQLLLVRTNRR